MDAREYARLRAAIESGKMELQALNSEASTTSPEAWADLYPATQRVFDVVYSLCAKHAAHTVRLHAGPLGLGCLLTYFSTLETWVHTQRVDPLKEPLIQYFCLDLDAVASAVHTVFEVEKTYRIPSDNYIAPFGVLFEALQAAKGFIPVSTDTVRLSASPVTDVDHSSIFIGSHGIRQPLLSDGGLAGLASSRTSSTASKNVRRFRRQDGLGDPPTLAKVRNLWLTGLVRSLGVSLLG